MRAEAAAARPASRAQSLERCYERRKFATNTFSKLQRRNHEELLDYEVREAAAVYADGVRRIKEALAAALASKRLRCSLAQAAAEQRLAEIRCILDDDTPDAPRAAKRRAEDDGRCDPAADVTNGAAADVVLRASLPDADIRDDLRAIAQQLRARAELFVAHAPQAEACVVRTPGLPPALKCGGTCFQMVSPRRIAARAERERAPCRPPLPRGPCGRFLRQKWR